MLPRIIERLLAGTTGNAYICSINPDRESNARDRERRVADRDARVIQDFAQTNDVPGRGTFFCVSTVKRSKRNKDNVVETPFLFADIDFKSVEGTKEEVLISLQGLDLPPSLIVFTGNGYHAYWFLDRPALIEDRALVENTLRRIAWALAGDPMVCHVATVLRYPGTHNSKRGQWTEIEEIWGDGDKYTLAGVVEWLDGIHDPVIARRARDRETNPFLAAADEMGFQAPMDVEQALRDMTPGGGDSGIHMTQLRAAASLMSAGASVDDATAQILEATRAHADSSWDMRAEEAAIRRMCQDWARKHPAEGTPARRRRRRNEPEDTEMQNGDGADGSGGNVVSLSQVREHRGDGDGDGGESGGKGGRKKRLKKGQEHVVLTAGILASLEDRGERILYTQGRMYLYRDGLWSMQTVDEERIFIDYQVESGCRALNIVATMRIAGETRGALRRLPELHVADVDWDGHGKIAVKNGLVDPETLELVSIRPDHYALSIMDVEYDRDARAPLWERLLEELIPDAPTRGFLQECVGMALIKSKSRALTRALILQGPSFSGKSTVLSIVSGLISDRVNSTPLSTLENSHGLVNFLSPHPWVLHEAFDQSRWEFSANVKLLLSGDSITVNIKNGPLVEHRYRGAVLWATNSPPQFKENTRAIETRIAIIKFKRAYDPGRVIGLAETAQSAGYESIAEMILAEERPGLLNWALEGMVRATRRKHFNLTIDMIRELEQVRSTSNVAVGFFEDCVEYDWGSMVRAIDLYAAFSIWWEENQGGSIPSPSALGRAIAAMADPRMIHGVHYAHSRVIVGVRLGALGLELWTAKANSVAMERSAMRISDREDAVNVSPLPEALRKRDEILDWIENSLGPEARGRMSLVGTPDEVNTP